jgi:hypothetical protein
MPLSQTELEQTLHKTTSLYNHLKNPELFAKIVLVTPEMVVLLFSGTFCFNCGILNYVEDFIHSFKVLTNKAELKVSKVKEINSHSFEVYFQVK